MTQATPDISIVIPVYNERDNVEALLDEIRSQPLADRIREMLFIDDGSLDGTTLVIQRLCAKDDRVKAIMLRRNFGKSAALDAGFRQATGEIIITMDGDGQDDPAEIEALVAKLDEGFDVVSGWKQDRHDPLSKTLPSRLFNGTMRLISGVRLHDFNCGLKAYREEVTREIDLYGERHRFIPVLAANCGFRVGEIAVNHRPRTHGKSKFGAKRLIRGFLDAITITFLGRYTQRPSHFFGLWGMVMFLAGLLINAYLTVCWFEGEALSNRPLLVLGVLLMLLGFQSVSVGLLSEMLISTRGADRHYSVRGRVNCDDD